MNIIKYKILYIIITLSLTLLSCGVNDTVNKAIDVFDKAIGRFELESTNWREIVDDARKELPKDIQSTISNELDGVVQRAISTAGVEFKCDVDFVRHRVKQDLIRIKELLLGKSDSSRVPKFCNVVPISVRIDQIKQNRQRTLTFFGYDFNSAGIEIFIQSSNGQKRSVTQHLSRPTHYQMTLNLASNGIGQNINKNDTKIVLMINGEYISDIEINSPLPQPTKPLRVPAHYTIKVHTGNLKDAGTDANLYITLNGSKGQSSRTLLDTNNHDDHERGSIDTYSLRTNRDLGEINQLYVSHDNSGDKSGWYLSKIVIENHVARKKWSFACNRWFSKSDEDRKISRTLFRNSCK